MASYLVSSETPWLDALRIIIFIISCNLASDVSRDAMRFAQGKPPEAKRLSLLLSTDWLTA
jgi:hypothetical protein